ncbi:MAG: DUF1295 domain-containing protein [Pirellulaceae bacterium]
MDLSSILLTTAVVIAAAVSLLWVISLPLKNASIADIFWGLGFVLIAAIAFTMGARDLRAIFVTVLTSIWGLRLTLYLAWRSHGKPEDSRYAAMRDHHGTRFWWVSFLTVFALQGAIMWGVSLPVQLGNTGDVPLGWFNYLGTAVWSIGFFFELVGDYQLARFKSAPENKGKVMDQGLWHYTRHPNYFGNSLIWWGLTMIAVTMSTSWLIISPIAMTFLLLKVSGVALLDKDLKNRSDQFRKYIQQTNAFLPWPPK